MKRTILILVNIVVLVTSLAFSAYLIRQRNRVLILPEVLSEQTKREEDASPLLLVFPKLDIKVAISPAEINDGKWEYSEMGVSYLSDSPLPGQIGNSIIYGHNWPNLLLDLKDAERGSQFSIAFSDGTVKDFEVQNVFTVTPDQTHILNQTEDARVTIYTCTGFLDSKRLVVVGTPKI